MPEIKLKCKETGRTFSEPLEKAERILKSQKNSNGKCIEIVSEFVFVGGRLRPTSKPDVKPKKATKKEDNKGE